MAGKGPELTPDQSKLIRFEADRPRTVADTVVEFTDHDIPQEQRRLLLGRLAGQTASAWRITWRPHEAVRWLVDTAAEVAPHITIRDLEMLRKHYPGLTPDALAERLIRNAARTTAGIGATGGGVASFQWAATPTLLGASVLLTAETLAVVAIELKLIGELHEAYGHPIPGTSTQRAVAMLNAWANRRGMNPLAGFGGMELVLGTASRKKLRDQIVKRFGRNLTTLGPLLVGAAVASYLNRRATLRLGDEIRKGLSGAL
jgi:hypothetical protein